LSNSGPAGARILLCSIGKRGGVKGEGADFIHRVRKKRGRAKTKIVDLLGFQQASPPPICPHDSFGSANSCGSNERVQTRYLGRILCVRSRRLKSQKIAGTNAEGKPKPVCPCPVCKKKKPETENVH